MQLPRCSRLPADLIFAASSSLPIREQSLSTLPGVVKVDGAERTAAMFSNQRVPSTAAAPRRRPRAPQQQQQQQQQPGGYLPPERDSLVHPMAAPVPVRASDVVSPSVWDLANTGGAGTGDGSIRGGGGAGPKGETFSSFGGSHIVAQTGGGGGSGGGYPRSQPAGVLLDGEGSSGCSSSSNGSTAAIMSASATLFSAEHRGAAWADSARRGIAHGNVPGNGSGHNPASQHGGTDVSLLGQQQATAHGVGSSNSRSSSSSPYACLGVAAAPPKRLKVHNSSAAMSVPPAGAARPVNLHLQGYAPLLGGVSPGMAAFGEAPAYNVPNTLADPAVGGIGLGELTSDAFGSVGDLSGGGVGASTVDVGSAWVDAVFDSESASSSPFLLNET